MAQPPQLPQMQPEPQAANPFAQSPGGASAASHASFAPVIDAIGQLLQAHNHTMQQLAERAPESSQLWSKIIPKPETFKPKTRDEELQLWPEFQWIFRQYVGAVSPKMLELMDEVEHEPDVPMDHATMAESEVSHSRALYALLASLTKGRPLNIVRSVSDSNGGEAYRLLVRTLSPTSKSRALALLGAIAQYPSFTTGSLLEQILKFR